MRTATVPPEQMDEGRIVIEDLHKPVLEIRVDSSYGSSKVHQNVHVPFYTEAEHSRQLNFPKGAIMSRCDMVVDIESLQDELVASMNRAPLDLRRPNSSNRLRHHYLDGSVGDEQPLLREEEKNLCGVITDDVEQGPTLSPSSRDVEHETFLITRLTLSVLRCLRLGCRSITKLLAMGLYTMCLLPGFLQVAYQYLFSKQVHRGIVYGDAPRNRLDLYLPENMTTPKPVVIFVTGGAWIIGYKAWGALLGLQLSERDIIVCCTDYRNYPQGGISDMVRDVSTAVGFIVNNIAQYGGDPDRIYLAGQSAGSHIAACVLIDQARKEVWQEEGTPSWKCSQMKAFVGISGAYNIPELVDHFHTRGLYRSLFLQVMEGEASLPVYSPELAVRSAEFAGAVAVLPPVFLLHGTADYSIPCEASAKFADALTAAGATVKTRFYADKTHTDVFLQDPLRGGHDPLFDDLLGVVHADDEGAKARDATAPLRRRLVPECLLQIARRVSPF